MVTRRDVSGAVGSLAARDRQRHEQQRRPAQLRQHRRRRTTNFARAILLYSFVVASMCSVTSSRRPHHSDKLSVSSLAFCPAISLQAARRRFAEQFSE